MISCQGASRDFAVLLDLWRALPPPPPRTDQAASYFMVTHIGSKWMEGENLSFIHRESQMRIREFLEKLTALYSGMEVVVLESSKAQPARKAGVAYLLVAAVRREEDGKFSHEVASEQSKQRLTYRVERNTTKKRHLVIDTTSDMLSPIESSIEDIHSRSAVLRAECSKKVPDSATALVLQSAISTSNTGLIKVGKCDWPFAKKEKKKQNKMFFIFKT